MTFACGGTFVALWATLRTFVIGKFFLRAVGLLTPDSALFDVKIARESTWIDRSTQVRIAASRRRVQSRQFIIKRRWPDLGFT